jgi:hypothetical protein
MQKRRKNTSRTERITFRSREKKVYRKRSPLLKSPGTDAPQVEPEPGVDDGAGSHVTEPREDI